MTAKASPKKIKKLSAKKVTIKDLGIRAGKGDAVKGGAFTQSCGGSVRTGNT
jgi:hypothetical protein